MNLIPIVLAALLAGAPEETPWREVTLSIFRDPYLSSDHVTILRVRAVNHGRRSWPGRSLRFEARGFGTAIPTTARGRFGLVLGPSSALETVVALPGRHDRFEVAPIEPGAKEDAKPRRRRR